MGGTVLAWTVLFFLTPEQLGAIYRCPVARWTGFKCPTCGATRALGHLVHGRFAEAFSCNPALFVLLPVICMVLMSSRARSSLVVWLLIAGLALAWGVYRNMAMC